MSAQGACCQKVGGLQAKCPQHSPKDSLEPSAALTGVPLSTLLACLMPVQFRGCFEGT